MYSPINDDLYDFAHNNGYTVLPFNNNSFSSISMIDDNQDCYIGINYSDAETSKEERVFLAHEIGHCITNSFYSANSPLFTRGKAEYQADRWAIEKLIPKKEFFVLLKSGMSAFELSEHFNVTQEYIYKAFRLYIDIEGVNAYEFNK